MSLFDKLQVPTTTLDFFIRTVKVHSYLPGRVRLYSKKMVGDTALEEAVRKKLLAFSELSEVTTSAVTGSILIKYDPGVLRQNPELRKVEEYIIAHAKNR